VIAIAITYLLGAMLGYSASGESRTQQADARHRIFAGRIAVVPAEWLSIGTPAIPRLATLARNDACHPEPNPESE